MILVTGAAGKTGSSLVRTLSRRDVQVRAAVRRSDQVNQMLALGAADARPGDLRNRDYLVDLLHGVDALYLICPNMRPDELSIAQLVVRACQIAGCRRIVYHSVLHPQTEEMPHHWQKMRVEELLFRSGLDYTILQPAAYMQNLKAYWPEMRNEGRYCVPYSLSTRLGMVDLDDVAEAAASVLLSDNHIGAIYEVATCEIYDQVAIAEIATEVLGKEVKAEQMPIDQWESGVRSIGLSAYAIGALRKMFLYYERYGFWGNEVVLTQLLGRRPTSLRSYLGRLAEQSG